MDSMVQLLNKLNLFKGPYQQAVAVFDGPIDERFVKIYSGDNRSKYPGIGPIDNWYRFSRMDTNTKATAYRYRNHGLVVIMEECNFNCCGKIPIITGDDLTVYEMIFVPNSIGCSAKNEEELFKKIIVEGGKFIDEEIELCKSNSFDKKDMAKEWHMAAKMIGFSYPLRQTKKQDIDKADLIKTLAILDEFYNESKII